MSKKEIGGLVLSLKKEEAVFLGADIEVDVVSISKSEVILRFVAPKSLSIKRGDAKFNKVNVSKNQD
jgi:carbon storage regulator CsrA